MESENEGMNIKRGSAISSGHAKTIIITLVLLKVECKVRYMYHYGNWTCGQWNVFKIKGAVAIGY